MVLEDCVGISACDWGGVFCSGRVDLVLGACFVCCGRVGLHEKFGRGTWEVLCVLDFGMSETWEVLRVLWFWKG